MTMYVPKYQTAKVTPSISLAAHSAQDVVSGLMKFTFRIPQQLGGGLIRGIRVIDADKQNADMDLYLFNEKPTTIAANAAFSLTAADVKKLITGALNTPAYVEHTGASIATYAATNFPIQFNAAKYLYGYLVAVATPDFASADALTVEIDAEF